VSYNALEHLELADWPFQINPSESFAKIWAGREEEKKAQKKLIKRMLRAKPSSFELLWGYFGAGKSHFQRNLIHECKDNDIPILTIYHELPQAPKNFLDFYRSFTKNIPEKALIDAFQNVFGELGEEGFIETICPQLPELYTALNAIAYQGGEAKAACKKWLEAEKINLNILKQYSINGRIEDVNIASYVVKYITDLFLRSGKFQRVIWMIDEFQRIANMTFAKRNESLHALQHSFDICSEGLTLLLSFSVTDPDNMYSQLTPEIKSRSRNSDPIKISIFDQKQADTFVKELLSNFRPEGVKPKNPYFPFSKDSINEVINIIDEDDEGENLIPRDIMSKLDKILNYVEDEELIENGKIKFIGEDEIYQALGQKTE